MPSQTSLPSLTKHLNGLAGKGKLDAGRLTDELRQRHPDLAAQIEKDRQRPELFAYWGRSSNIDAGAKKAVVQEPLLLALSEALGQDFDPAENVANAGMLHTYGYLLSNLRTPFGYKRARWCQGHLERGLELPAGWLSAAPKSGTLPGHLTTLFQRFFFVSPEAKFGELEPDWCPGAFAGFTLRETASDGSIMLVTRVIEFNISPSKTGGNGAALFYAAEVENRLHFVTAFPVAPWMLGKLRKSAKSAAATIKPRYNAVIPQLQGRPAPGTVELQPWPEI